MSKTETYIHSHNNRRRRERSFRYIPTTYIHTPCTQHQQHIAYNWLWEEERKKCCLLKSSIPLSLYILFLHHHLQDCRSDPNFLKRKWQRKKKRVRKRWRAHIVSFLHRRKKNVRNDLSFAWPLVGALSFAAFCCFFFFSIILWGSKTFCFGVSFSSLKHYIH